MTGLIPEEVIPTGFFLSPRHSSADLQNSLAVLSQAGPMAAASSEATTRLRVTRFAFVSDKRPCSEHICQRTLSFCCGCIMSLKLLQELRNVGEGHTFRRGIKLPTFGCTCPPAPLKMLETSSRAALLSFHFALQDRLIFSQLPTGELDLRYQAIPPIGCVLPGRSRIGLPLLNQHLEKLSARRPVMDAEMSVRGRSSSAPAAMVLGGAAAEPGTPALALPEVLLAAGAALPRTLLTGTTWMHRCARIGPLASATNLTLNVHS